MTKTEMVKEFHEAFNLPVNVPWGLELFKFRQGLLQEELEEYLIEATSIMVKLSADMEVTIDDKARLVKEMSDIIYILAGTAVSLGLPLDEVFTAVHESNMSKLGPDGKPVYREDGKVMKGSQYRPPNVIKVMKKELVW